MYARKKFWCIVQIVSIYPECVVVRVNKEEVGNLKVRSLSSPNFDS